MPQVRKRLNKNCRVSISLLFATSQFPSSHVLFHKVVWEGDLGDFLHVVENDANVESWYPLHAEEIVPPSFQETSSGLSFHIARTIGLNILDDVAAAWVQTARNKKYVKILNGDFMVSESPPGEKKKVSGTRTHSQKSPKKNNKTYINRIHVS